MGRRGEALTVLALLAGVPGLDAGGTYTPVAPLHVARQEYSGAMLRGRLCAVGGLGPGNAALKSVEVYDAAANAWSFLADLPETRHHAAIAVVTLGASGAAGELPAAPATERLYAVGGFPDAFTARAEVYAYDPDLNSWTRVADLPEQRGAGAAAGIGGRLYFVGGTNSAGDAMRTLYVYDPYYNRWTIGPDMPTPREHLCAVAHGVNLHVIGGRNRGDQSAAHEVYDTVQNRWSLRRPLPTARAASAATLRGGRIHVLGGETPRLFSEHEVYDPIRDAWSTETPMLVPRHGLPAGTLPGGGILLPGGATAQGYQPTDYVDMFQSSQLLGDLNCDGAVDFGDIDPFVLALTDPAGFAARYPNCPATNGDFNGNGRVDFGDIDPFVALLAGS